MMHRSRTYWPVAPLVRHLQVSDTQPLTYETRLIAPLTTYIMTGMQSVPEKIQRKIEETGGEICPNLMYLGMGYLPRVQAIIDFS